MPSKRLKHINGIRNEMFNRILAESLKFDWRYVWELVAFLISLVKTKSMHFRVFVQKGP